LSKEVPDEVGFFERGIEKRNDKIFVINAARVDVLITDDAVFDVKSL